MLLRLELLRIVAVLVFVVCFPILFVVDFQTSNIILNLSISVFVFAGFTIQFGNFSVKFTGLSSFNPKIQLNNNSSGKITAALVC